MNPSDLERLGLNKNEARVFLALLKNGPSIASELVKITGFHRNIVYDNLDKLVERGLVGYIFEEGKRKFTASPPESIVDMLEREQNEIDEKREIAKKLLPALEAELLKSKEKQSAIVYRGKKAFRALLREVIAAGEYRAMGVSNASVEILGTDFWKNFIMQVKKKKVREKLLINSDFDLNQLPITSPGYTEICILPVQANMVTEILLYAGKIAIMVYTDPPIATVIYDRHAYDSFLQYFDQLSRISKSLK